MILKVLNRNIGLLIFVFLANLYAIESLAQIKKLNTQQDFIDTILYYRYSNPDSAKIFANQGITLAKRNNNELFLAAMLNQFGMIEDNLMMYNDAKVRYREAQDLYQKNNDSIGLASTLIRLGEVERRKWNFSKALELAKNALKISEKLISQEGILEAELTIGKIYYDFEDYDNAYLYLNKALKLSESLALSSHTINTYINLGKTLGKKKEFELSIEILNRALLEVEKLKGNAGLKINIFKALGKIYIDKGESVKGIKYLKQSLQLSIHIKNKMRELSLLQSLAHATKDVDVDSALNYSFRALKIAKHYNILNEQIEVLNQISILYQKKGAVKEALNAGNERFKLFSEYYKNYILKQFGNLESAYDLELSKSKVLELTKKNNEQKLLNNLWFAIIIGLFIIFDVILFYFFRSKKLNELLRVTNKELNESNHVKDKIFSIIAHDIRSPLISITGVLNLIAEGDLDKQQKTKIFKKLINDSQNSLEVLDKLLKWGEMQLKGMRLDTTDFYIKPIILETADFLKPLIDNKFLKLEIRVDEQLKVSADSNQFDFIIRNLLSNAIKFTELNGKIEILAEKVEGKKLKVSIKDNGVGMTAEKLKTLFELSTTSTKGTSSEVGNSLGLLIVKEFIEANNGEILVESTLGEGSIFSVILPLAITNIA